MASENPEHSFRDCGTDTCNGFGYIECWYPGGPCAEPNRPDCELCGDCNECREAHNEA